MLGREYLHSHPPVKPWPRVSSGLPSRQHFIYAVLIQLQKNQALLGFMPGFHHALPHTSFPFADLALDSSAVGSHDRDNSHMLSPLSPPDGSSDLCVALDTGASQGTRKGFPEEVLFGLRPRMKIAQLIRDGTSVDAVYSSAQCAKISKKSVAYST